MTVESSLVTGTWGSRYPPSPKWPCDQSEHHRSTETWLQISTPRMQREFVHTAFPKNMNRVNLNVTPRIRVNHSRLIEPSRRTQWERIIVVSHGSCCLTPHPSHPGRRPAPEMYTHTRTKPRTIYHLRGQRLSIRRDSLISLKHET